MTAMKLLIPLALALALFAPAAAEYSLNQVAVFADMEQDRERFFVNLTCTAGEVEYFDFAALTHAKAASFLGEPLRTEVLQQVFRVYFSRPVRAGESYAFYAEFEGTDAKRLGDETIYYKSLSFPVEVKRFSFVIRLPRNVYPEISTYGASCTNPECGCKETGICICENCTGGAACSVSSWHSATTLPPDEIGILENRVSLGWARTLKANEKFEIGLLYSSEEQNLRYVIAAITLVSAFASGFVLAWRRKRASAISYVLNEEEKLIVDFIKSRGGEVMQEDIWKESSFQFSRPKVSRIIADLEQRGVLKREAYKKTFKVSLVAF